MNKRQYKMTLCLLLSFTLLINLAAISSGEGITKNISSSSNIITVDDDGDEDYTSIQDAIDNAVAGDSIHVFSGNYSENIILDKTLTLVGIEENDEGLPRINPLNKSNTTVKIISDGCTFENFFVNGSNGFEKSAIKIRSNSNVIKNNTIFNSSFFGIRVVLSVNNVFEKNTFFDNNYALRLSFSNRNIIKDNYFIDNWAALWIHNSKFCKVFDNYFERNYYALASMYKANFNVYSDNTFVNNSYGIDFFKSDINSIKNNFFNNTEYDGIRFFTCCGNIMKYNHLENCGYNGIQSALSMLFVIVNNNIINCSTGVYLRSYDGFHTVKSNNFIKNNVSGKFFDSVRNRWVNNYWDDWSGSGAYPIHGYIKPFRYLLKPKWTDITPWTVYDRNPAEEPFDLV